MTGNPKLRLLTLTAASIVALSTGARAQNLLFTITETGKTITFTVPETPTPSDYSSSLGGYFDLDDVDVTANGSTLSETVTFYGGGGVGGFSGPQQCCNFSILGSKLYTGDLSAPTLTPGTYDNQYDMDTSGFATLTVGSPTPEPAAWTLILVGVGGLGGALRARREPSLA